MNTTTKADREKWIARAKQLIKMDSDTRVTNSRDVADKLIQQYGISRGSAQTAIAHAAMQIRAVFR